MVCQWASMSPGMSTRPPPGMTVAPASAPGGIEPAEAMRSILLPRTRTSDGPDRPSPFPSKTRTFWNSVTGPGDGAGVLPAGAASAGDEPPRRRKHASRARTPFRFESIMRGHLWTWAQVGNGKLAAPVGPHTP